MAPRERGGGESALCGQKSDPGPLPLKRVLEFDFACGSCSYHDSTTQEEGCGVQSESMTGKGQVVFVLSVLGVVLISTQRKLAPLSHNKPPPPSLHPLIHIHSQTRILDYPSPSSLPLVRERHEVHILYT
jgi:hypothetical protein